MPTLIEMSGMSQCPEVSNYLSHCAQQVQLADTVMVERLEVLKRTPFRVLLGLGETGPRSGNSIDFAAGDAP